MNENCFSR